MKKVYIFLVAIILILIVATFIQFRSGFVVINFVSPSIETAGNYSLGEGFIAKISGTFYQPPTPSNIQFYHGQTPTSFDPYSFDKIDGSYYISFNIPPGKEPGNYSIRVSGVQYFVGNEWKTDPVSKEFVIKEHSAFARISPALSIPEDYEYNLTLQNLRNSEIEIEYYLEGTTSKIVTLNVGQTKQVSLKTFGGNQFENVLFNYENETYTVLVYSGLDEIPVENQTTGENETGNETGEENGKSWWEIIFGGGEEEPEENETIVNETEPNETETNGSTPPPGGLLTCQEMGLLICSTDQTCSGVLIDGLDAQCCDGNCVLVEEEGSSLGLIGWIIIGIVVILLVLFFKFKFSRTRRMPSRLLRR